MQAPRFWYDAENRILVLETSVPLTPYQEKRCASFALPVFRQRYLSMHPGPRRDTVGEVIDKLRNGQWVIRPVPKYDCEKEAIIV